MYLQTKLTSFKIFLLQFAKEFNNNILQNKMQFKCDEADGYYYADELEPNCTYLISTVKNVKENIEVSILPSSKNDLMLGFSFYNNGSELSIKIENTEFNFPQQIFESSFLNNMSFPINYKIDGNVEISNICILFNKCFLIENNVNLLDIDKLYRFSFLEDKTLLQKTINFSTKEDCVKLFSETALPKPNKLVLKNIILKLLYDYISAYENDSFEAIENNNFQLSQQILHKITKIFEEEKALKLADIAKHFYISESKLKKIFKESYNKSIYEYYQELRLEKSINLLSNTNMLIKDIARKNGFNSESKFSEFIKRTTKRTPSSYRSV